MDAVLAHVVPGAALRLEDLRHLHSPTLMARSGAVLGVECGRDGSVPFACKAPAWLAAVQQGWAPTCARHAQAMQHCRFLCAGELL